MPADTRLTPAVTRRYQDAYTVAAAVIGIGNTIKGIALVIGGLFALGGLIISTQGVGGMMAGVGTVAFGVGIGIVVYLVGILISAQGQVVRATLDTAVNTSPFLDDRTRASILTLPVPTQQSAPLPAQYQGGM